MGFTYNTFIYIKLHKYLFIKLHKIISISIKRELQNSYLEYAMSVIIRRALPDCRDGLKPVHRRILFAMYKNKGYNNSYKKSARIVGEVMGRFHPHGDNAIYSAIVRMTQNFLLQIPLIKGQGNFGSIDGDSAAQMRYTEIKLSNAAQYMLEDINKNIVEFQNNYDATEFEPKVLPAQFPNLVINGATGIAVGMATNIPTHNLQEVIEYCIDIVDNKERIKETLIPDFPTKGEIINKDETIKSLCKGQGTIKIRGKIIIEKERERKNLIIQEIPYQVNKIEIINSIENLVKNKIINSIISIRDETNKLGIRIVLETNFNDNIEVLINKIYKKTALQSNFYINMLSLNEGNPKITGIEKIMHSFVYFRKNTIKKKIRFLLFKARKRIHILLGSIVTIINLNEIIISVKNSINLKITKKNLIRNKWETIKTYIFNDYFFDKEEDIKSYLNETQVEGILNIKLNNLTFLEKNKITNDITSLFFFIKSYIKYLTSKKEISFIIKKELIKIKSILAFPRKTTTSDLNENVNDIDLTKREAIVIILTKEGFIKKIPLELYKAQKRGGKGKISMKMYKNDIAIISLVANTHSSLLFFSSTGKVHELKVSKIPLLNVFSKGKALINLLILKKKEEIRSIMHMPETKTKWDKLNILFVTQNGKVRKNRLKEFANINSNGKIAIKLNNNDRLISVATCNSKSNILLATARGKAIKFSASSIRIFKSRTSDGVKAIKLLNKEDKVVSMSILSAKNFCKEKYCDYREFILTITCQGYGKRTASSEYKKTKRNNLGVLNINTCPRNGYVVSSFPVYKNEEIILMTTLGKIIRTNIDKIRITNRNAKGVKIITLEKKERVASVSSISNK